MWAATRTISFFAWIGFAIAQAPTGAISGIVRDPSGGVVSTARIRVLSTATGGTRTITASGEGSYSFPALLAGEYDVSAEAPGFQRISTGGQWKPAPLQPRISSCGLAT